MITLRDIAETFHPRKSFSKIKNGLAAGDELFFTSCVRDSHKWKTSGGYITWDIVCPFCQRIVMEAVQDWALHTGIGKVGCVECQVSHMNKVRETRFELETAETACYI